MNNRLLQFLAAENISQSQFADSIGVARANISHIIAGRNKPGFDFIESTIKHYPSLNIEWLISGKGRMYKSEKEQSSSPVTDDSTLFGHITDSSDKLEPEMNSTDMVPPYQNISEFVKVSDSSKRTIKKIVILYDDATYQEIV